MSSLSPSTRVCTERMAVNGGSTTTSTSVSCCSVNENASFWVSAIASRWLLFIFQLPAMSGRRRRAVATSVLQYRDAGQLSALQVLQRRAAAGGNVGERRLVEAQGPHGGRGIAAADDGQPVDLGDRLGDHPGAGGERRQLEHPHRA